MFEDFMNDKCNIYHTTEKNIFVGYGIKERTVKSMGTAISLQNIQCHFHTKFDTIRIEQNKPFSSTSGELKLSLPLGVNICKNDIVEDCANGMKYRAGIPKTIHGHHIVVSLYSEGGIKSAI